MALVKRSDGFFLVRQEPLQWGTIKQARAYLSMQLQTALDLAAGLRDAGIEAYASSDSGQEQDPAYVPPTATVDLTVQWASTWRVEIEELGTNRYCHRFVDQFNVQHSVIGKTPQEIADKLNGSVDPVAREYVRRITPEPEVAPPPPPPIPVAPRKFLRPGDRGISESELAEMEEQRAKQQAPKVPPVEVEYAYFYNTAPTNDTRKRMKSDAGYLTWLEKTGVLTPRSNADAR